MKNRTLRVALQDPQLRVNRIDAQTGTAGIVLILTGLAGLAFIIKNLVA